jgi:hypothetical protein
MEKRKITKVSGGSPQGGVISPVWYIGISGGCVQNNHS